MIINKGQLELHAPRPTPQGREIPFRDTVTAPANRGICPAYWSQLFRNSLPLMVADLLALACTLGLVYGVASRFEAAVPIQFGWILTLSGSMLIATFSVLRLYPGIGMNAVNELRQIGLAIALLLATLLVAASVYGADAAILLTIVFASTVLLVGIPLLRAVARSLAAGCRWWGQPVLIFGDGEKRIG